VKDNFDLKKYLTENRLTPLSKHSKEHPDFINYKGAKYRRVGLVNENQEAPIAGSECYVITMPQTVDGPGLETWYEAGNPEQIANDTLRQFKQNVERHGFDPNEIPDIASYIEEYFSEKPRKVDQYSYYASYGDNSGDGIEGRFFLVCTKGKGKWSFLYDLAENNDDEGIYDALDRVLADLDDTPEARQIRQH
jgi:hypothetical protein